jgi:pimeloyl-[acyl-carrier protein] methyl ester esterase
LIVEHFDKLAVIGSEPMVSQSAASTDQARAAKKIILVLLPGLDGTEIFFGPLLAVLPSWIQPLVVTYPTSGVNDYLELLPVVRNAVQDCDEFYVLGWSFSGPLALMLAAAEPKRVRGVILGASFVRSPLPLLSALRFAVLAPVVHLVRLAHRLHLRFTKEDSGILRQDKAATLARVPSRIVAARARVILTFDARDYLRRCAQPVLYVAGSQDKVVPARNAAEVVRELPSTKLVTIDGPHLALYTNPCAAADAIVTFMQRSG